MCTVQSASVGNCPEDMDDFIANLFSQNITNIDNKCHETLQCHEIQPIQNESAEQTWLLANQMDHNYTYQESSTLLSPTWEEPIAIKSSTVSLNMSTYFSTFDPSNQCYTNLPQQSVIQPTMEKIHQARVNYAPTTTGNVKGVVKRKRKRTVFRTDQVEAMEEVFAKKPYITREDRQALVSRLNISDKSVKVWFQNRRLKNKRVEDHSISDDDNSSPTLDRLDDVESKIHERTDNFGYVTLDDRMMYDIMNVIDDFLQKPKRDSSSKNNDLEASDITMVETILNVESIPVYEPISPASTIDCSNEEISWDCQTKIENEYWQTLNDIESIISN